MNTFKYKKGDHELYIGMYLDELRFIVSDEHFGIAVSLDQVGLDALRNYLDDLETEEQIK